ncbi:MAG TPA: precorrin-2 C(20)-methyltransferase [Nitrospiraceae bacterium]|nr:MAG: precorrin-2 C(20)-methyltransferase [Nitrospirae bacterium GWA2_46_11]HCZ12292.1 precorrin-2 C(20)-methyltransferase [Nitrospiraceae bacterium]
MTGKLYVIGVGPGDPELLTLKAVRVLREVPCICVPKGREEGNSLALSIVQKARIEGLTLEGKEIIEAHFPMRKTRNNQESENCELDTKWQETIETVYSRLNKGIDMAFITIGDPTIYSTFFYLYDKLLALNPELNIEIVPGVSSINTAAAKAGMSLALADEKIAILPATYTESIKETLERFDTIVLMKVHKVFGNVAKILSETGLTDKAVYISRAGMDDERIFRNIRDIKESDLDYFSLMIIKK